MQDQRTGVPPGTTEAETCSWLARLASRLGDLDDDALPDALTVLVHGLGLRSALLRDARDGEVLAVAGDVVRAVPSSRVLSSRPQGVVEVPVAGTTGALATLTVVGARPSHLPGLRAACAVLALGLRRPAPQRLALALLEAADAAADAAVDDLHDGPVQQLAAARYAADVAARGGDLAPVRDAVQASLIALRRALWLLRPRAAGGEGLAVVLPQLSSHLQEAGRPGLLLDLDAAASARLPSAAASVCYRLVQEVAGQAGDPATGVRLSAGRRAVRLEVDGDLTAVAHAAGAWSARARALGADLHVPPTGRHLVLTVPVPPLAPPTSAVQPTSAGPIPSTFPTAVRPDDRLPDDRAPDPSPEGPATVRRP